MDHKIRLFGVETLSVVDGEGLRYVIFVQGCPHSCPGCHNPESHPFTGGYVSTVSDVIADIKPRITHLDGITFSGGEPFFQQDPLIDIAKWAKSVGLNVWCYTGYTYEYLKSMVSPLLKHIDVLVDGPFIEEQKNPELMYRGSDNQRIIRFGGEK